MGARQVKVDRLHPSTIDLSLTRIEELARREGQSTATGAAGYAYGVYSFFYLIRCCSYNMYTHTPV